jgi:nicotinamidase-related amidase
MKKIALLVVGVADGFCSANSPRALLNHEEMVTKVSNILSNSGKRLGCLVNINNPADTYEDINIQKLVSDTKVMNIKLCVEELFHPNNEISIVDHDKTELLFNGDQIDFLLPPESYDVHICGIDINGIFISTIEKLIKLGYNVTVYSDVIKPFSKKTVQFIKGSQCKFTSGKNVCLT